MSSTTHSQSDTRSRSESFSNAFTRSSSESRGEAVSRGVNAAVSDGVSVGRSLGTTQGWGMGLGAVPSFGMSQTYQWYDDQAIQVTAMLRAYEALLHRATLEGAYYTDFYVLTATEEGAAVTDAAVRQAFQGNGPLVVTPVQTRQLSPEEQAYIRTHARAFVPSTRAEATPGTYEAYRDATLLLPTQLAAHTAPLLRARVALETPDALVVVGAFTPEPEALADLLRELALPAVVLAPPFWDPGVLAGLATVLPAGSSWEQVAATLESLALPEPPEPAPAPAPEVRPKPQPATPSPSVAPAARAAGPQGRLGFYGLRGGAGTTTATLAAARFLAGRGLHVALFDATGRGDTLLRAGLTPSAAAITAQGLLFVSGAAAVFVAEAFPACAGRRLVWRFWTR